MMIECNPKENGLATNWNTLMFENTLSVIAEDGRTNTTSLTTADCSEIPQDKVIVQEGL